MPYVDGFDDETAPFDDDKPQDELIAEDKGWSQKRYDELQAQFKELTGDEIDTFIENFVRLPQPREEMNETDIFKFVAEQHSYEEVVERFDII